MSTDPQLRLSMANANNVPKEFVRAVDPHLLPPRVGHNWNDQAFREKQGKPQQLEAEFRGLRVFPATQDSTFAAPAPDMCRTAQQLVDALRTAPLNRSAAARTARVTDALQDVTLDDKVLRFYAFFNERAPEAGEATFWHRKVVISFFPVDDTVLIEEPRIVNSGLDGGVFLKRQKVVADPRQREMFPQDEFVTLNFFNVGDSVRLNAIDFFLYDCDEFTRAFMTSLGIEVGAAVECPDDLFMSDYGRYQERLLSGKFGLLTQDYSGDEVERSVRFIRDGGKMLRFYGVLDERETIPGGMVRMLEVMLFVEDNSIAILQRQSNAEGCRGLYLSRCWLPKSGSIAKANELTFMHRVNGQREPDMGGPDAYYRDVDLKVGMSLQMFGRSVLLYDCDDYTREFYMERYGIALPPPVDISRYVQGDVRSTVLGTAPPAQTVAGGRTRAVKSSLPQAATVGGVDTGSLGASSASPAPPAEKTPADTLRFRAELIHPANHDDEQRRFTVTYYTDTMEFMVYESAFPSAGIHGGCVWKRRKVMKLPPKPGPRNAPTPTVTPGELPYYTLSDLGEGKELIINGLHLRLYRMDTHTATFYARSTGTIPEDAAGGSNMVTDATGALVTVDHLVAELRGYLQSRYGSGVASFLALDRDRDGIVSVPEFTSTMKAFQITEDKAAAAAIFARIAPARDTAYFTSVDLMKWMDAMNEEHRMNAVRITSMPSGGKDAELKEIEHRALLSKVLRELKSRLDARCWKGVDMFRLASTMPRAYRGRRTNLYCLTNPDRDAVITPVQLRRCIEEILTGTPTPAEMSCLLEFFFPNLPKEAYTQTSDRGTTYAVDINEFQKKYYVMTKETMLPDDDAPAKAPTEADAGTS